MNQSAASYLLLASQLALVACGPRQSGAELYRAATRGDFSAMQQLRSRAEKGDAASQFSMGLIYDLSEGSGVVPKDNALALHWYRLAAEQGLPEAQDNLAWMYLNAIGIPQNTGEAVRWYRRAGEQGYSDSLYHLGLMYKQGDDISKDATLAVHWLQRAAEGGSLSAQMTLGTMYQYGDDVVKDSAMAARWYRRAAEKGSANAKYLLGWMYHHGEGVPKDLVSAYMWLNLAAAQGDETAKLGRDELEEQITKGQVAEAQRLSRAWKPKR
jgi:TPR repeat protein